MDPIAALRLQDDWGMTFGRAGQAGGFRGRSPLGEGVAALRQAQGPLSLGLAMEARGTTAQGECCDRPLAGWHDRAEQLGL